MHVNEKMAREAADLLAFPSLDTVDLEGVKEHYRTAAKGAHPDAGGSAEAFAQVDRAKHILLAWLEKVANAPPPAQLHGKRPCEACDGMGHITLQSGRPGRLGLRRQCQRCHGSGDADYDAHGLH